MQPRTSTTLWFDRPGDDWFDGVPIGNGRTGAMVTGGIPAQTFHLNDETFWSPAPRERDFPEAPEAFARVRRLLADGDVLGAQAIAPRLLGTPPFGGALQPIGDLLLRTDVSIEDAAFTRSLDLATGLASFVWTWDDGRTLVREVVAARSPSVFLVRQRASHAFGPTEVSLDSPFGLSVAGAPGTALIGSGWWRERARNRPLLADSYRLRDWEGTPPLEYAIGVRAFADGASVQDGTLALGSQNWTVAVAIGTSFHGRSPGADVQATLLDLPHQVDALFDRAMAAHATVFGRTSISLRSDDPLSGLSTDQRVRAVRAGGLDDHLVLVLADFGRYLQIASTLGGAFPPTLQGVWNADTEPAWSSNYTLNINLQMALWSADAYRFHEGVDVLRSYVEKLAVAGRRTAAEVYGADGWVVHHNSDIWMNTAPTTLVEVGLFAGAGPWLVQQLVQHHDSYPERGGADSLLTLLVGLIDFFQTWLVVDADGFLASSPSSSPENGYLLGRTARPRSRKADPEFWRHGWIGQASTLDMLLVRDTLRSAIRLGEALDASEEELARWGDMLQRLRPVFLQDGEIPEWTWPHRPLELGHRHLSPLYGVYPGTEDHRSPSQLRDAAWRTLINRQAKVESDSNGWGGWSRVWAAACWARLGEGDRALASLQSIVATSIAPDSLLHAFPGFDEHPGMDAVHQSDANFGWTAVVAEMVLQSVPGTIHLLPALPARWTCGSVSSIRARGGVDVSFEWADSRVLSAVLVSTTDQTVTLSAPDRSASDRTTLTVTLLSGVATTVAFSGTDGTSESETMT